MDDFKYNFQTLTPVSDVKLNIYLDALNFAMETPSVKNIAVSGPYGAGKSSLLETYEKQNDKAAFLHISLAHFNPVDTSERTSEDIVENSPSPITDKVIEGKIINQLIHQTDSSKIPQTDFKTMAAIPADVRKKLCIASVVTVIALLHMILFGTWTNLVNSLTLPFLRTILSWTAHYDSLLLSGVVCLIALSYGIYYMVKTQKFKKTLKKISLQGNDIEIFSDDTDSYFDKHLNETLYLFENCGADNIVFEDMDRYNSNHIFEKLREMNTLINNRKKSDEPILRFFYLLRDDIFENKDRTKFFDYIIPVVPVIDGSNSINMFLSVFKDAGIQNEFLEAFLNDLSLYIDDMRILKNICNEYVIYSEQISEIELKKDKLLAILAYKNLFPRDFSSLHLRKGYVFNLFKNALTLSEAEIEKVKNGINEIDDLLSTAKNEMLESFDELDALYLLPENTAITNIDGTIPPAAIRRAELAKLVRASTSNVTCTYNRQSNDFLVSDKLSELEKDPVYVSRKRAIEVKESDKAVQLKAEMHSLKRKLLILQGRHMKDIIPLVGDEKAFNISYSNPYVVDSKDDFEDIKDSDYFPLIAYLIRNGYIDESYNDYMTYFYSESITAVDKVFLRSIADHQKKDYAYVLNDPSRVLMRIQAISFSHIEVLNFNLIDCLLAEARMYPDHFSMFMKQLEETRNFDYIIAHWENGREKASFIQALNHYWPNVFECILSESTLTDIQKHQYAVDTLYYSPANDIHRMDANNTLSRYISNNPTFLDIRNPNVDTIIQKFELLKIKFITIDYASANSDLFTQIYRKDMYLFSSDNILSMLRNVYRVEGEDVALIQKCFTLVFERTKEPLSAYVQKNIERLLASVLDSCNESIADDESTAIQILNNPEIEDIAMKEAYIRYLQTPITDITQVKDKTLWSIVLDAQIATHTGANILKYYFSSTKKLDKPLIDFINAQMPTPCDFSIESIVNAYGDKKDEEFALDIIKCNNITNDRYEAIIRSLDICYSSFLIPNIDHDKVSILIDLNVIPMTKDELLFMRKTYEEVVIHFIVHNIDVFMDEVVNDECFGSDDASEILRLLLEPIDENYKVKILEFYPTEIPIRNQSYSDGVVICILEHNYDNNDLSYLIDSFVSLSEPIKDIVITKCLHHIDGVVDFGKTLDIDLYNALITSSQLDTSKKIELFYIQISCLSITQAINTLNAIGLSEYCKLFEQKQVVVTDDVVSSRLLETFKKCGWDFKVEQQNGGSVRIYGKQINSQKKNLACRD